MPFLLTLYRAAGVLASIILFLMAATNHDFWLRNLDRARLTGELVDTKCYFGVMRPANGKVQRRGPFRPRFIGISGK
jgi:hypothetical protein